MSDWSFKRKKPVTADWPKDERGEPIPPVFLQHVSGGPLDTELTVNCWRPTASPCHPVPQQRRVRQGDPGYVRRGHRHLVPATMKDDALNILSADIVEEDGNDSGK
jgi:hypothetical protein